MNMCLGCYKEHEESGWYMDYSLRKVLSTADCDVHPTMKNWRVVRTLRTIHDWCGRGDGFKHKMLPKESLTIEDSVDTVAAYKILFDYEQPFILHLIKEGYLRLDFKNFHGSETVKMTKKGKEFVSNLPPED